MRYLNLTGCLILFATGCAGTRFKLAQQEQPYGLSTSELLVLDTVDEALDGVEKAIEAEGLPPGTTASLDILGIHSPTHLHPYIRRLVVARLENRGLTFVTEKKVVPQGDTYYEDTDFEYWSADLGTEKVEQAGPAGPATEEAPESATELTTVKQELLSGAESMLVAEPGDLPDLRLVLALRMAGVDIFVKDLVVFEESSLICRVHAKFCAFGDSKVKVYEGTAESPKYVFNRRLLKFIPLPAPYKELETDRRSVLRKLLDGIMGARQATQAVYVQGQPWMMPQ